MAVETVVRSSSIQVPTHMVMGITMLEVTTLVLTIVEALTVEVETPVAETGEVIDLKNESA